ncbi:MAG: hypothetical protein SPF21_06875 [Candidatus Methanomethylophilaceae archaeon]|nr:hypothetical protein [Candidatus Methanomethylophilaceae archaeon]
MKISMPEIPGITSEKGLDSSFKKVRASNVEKEHMNLTVVKSVVMILILSLAMFLVIVAINDVWSFGDYMNNIFCNTIALVFVVVFLDTLVSSNKEGRKKREEARTILRHNRIIQPDIDMYLVRKNMVVTPNGKNVRKFQIDSQFSIQDMRDMYGPSELVSDVGISKIRRYAYFQKQLKKDFENLVEGVDFTHYPEIAEAAMKYINATSYGEAALDAVVGYEDSKAGTRSMRVMVVGMMKEEPLDGRFMDANPTMKNIYLVYQMINDQEKAVSDYIRLIGALEDENPSEKRSNTDYE